MTVSSVQAQPPTASTDTTAAFGPSLSGRQPTGWKPWVFVFIALQALVIGAIALLNYVVNPMGFYSTHRFAPMVWNGREEKVTALASENPKPEVLVLGSSRVWTISPAAVTAQLHMTSFNAGVSVGMAEDDYSLLRYAVEQAHIQPKLVIIGLDLEALHNARPVDQRTQDVPELRAFLPRTSLGADLERMKSLVTAQSFALSMTSLRLASRGKNETPPDPIYTVGKHGDTHLSGVEHRLASGQSTPASETQTTIGTYLKRYAGYTALSPERLNYLRRTLEYCAERHIKAVVYLTPTSTAVQAALDPKGFQTLRRAALIEVPKMTKATGAAFVDYTDVDTFGGSQSSFLDGVHMNQETGSVLLAHLIADTHLLP